MNRRDSFEPSNLVSRRNVPYACGVICTCGQGLLAIGRKRNRSNGSNMPLKAAHHFTRTDITQLQSSVPNTDKYGMTIRRKSNGTGEIAPMEWGKPAYGPAVNLWCGHLPRSRRKAFSCFL